MTVEDTQPQPEIGSRGEVRIFCDRKGYAGVSNEIGDKAAVIEWIADLCQVADLEYDEDALPDKIVISIPPGS